MPTASEADQAIVISDKATDQSKPFIGQWNQLISTTNWDKGAIIVKWRTSLEESKASATEFSDEAWSQLVGGVTPQHVGRLRRTYDRFGHVFSEYDGIYWSHFYASLDWEDAEMWLEGAVQSKWSVSQMRHHRWETLGKDPEDKPTDTIVSTELNEETQSLDLSERKRQNDRDYIEGPVHEGPDFGDEPDHDEKQAAKRGSSEDGESEPSEKPAEKVRPFESFTELPDDVMEASSAFKVAIIRHKTEEWEAIQKPDMLGLLDALKQLVSAPSE